MYKTAQESMFVKDQEEEAFSFHFLKGMHQVATLQNLEASPRMRHVSEQEEKVMNVNLTMASICYVHSPKLLHDIVDCFSDLKDYTSSVATTLKSAASEVATKIVNKRSTDILNLESFSTLNESTFYSNLSLDETSHVENFSDEPETKIILNAQLETPVIVIPRTSSSSEVLVAHLGKITINNNSHDAMQKEEEDRSVIYHERLSVEAKDMNLYAVDIDNPKSKVEISLDQSTMYKSVYNQSECGVPIMHDTTVKIMIDLGHTNVSQEQELETVYLGEESVKSACSLSKNVTSQNVIDVLAKISTPIKLELCKGVYEQVLQTVDNLTYDEKTHGMGARNVPSSTSFTSVQRDKGNDIPEDTAKTEEAVLSKSESKSEDVGMIMKISFEVPLFNVELKGDFDEGEKGLVDLKLHNFSLEFEKSNSYSTNIEIQLQSLTMEDLLVGADSDYKYLLISRVSKADDQEHMRPRLFLSHSCPDSTIFMPTATLPLSLPSSFYDNMSHLTKGSASDIGHQIPFKSSKASGYKKSSG
jgi:vacuolar protein sorting-associated protein 13D